MNDQSSINPNPVVTPPRPPGRYHPSMLLLHLGPLEKAEVRERRLARGSVAERKLMSRNSNSPAPTYCLTYILPHIRRPGARRRLQRGPPGRWAGRQLMLRPHHPFHGLTPIGQVAVPFGANPSDGSHRPALRLDRSIITYLIPLPCVETRVPQANPRYGKPWPGLRVCCERAPMPPQWLEPGLEWPKAVSRGPAHE